MALVLGSDIIDFYDHGWPEGFYHDENELEIHNDDGSWALDALLKYETDDLGLLISEVDIYNRITFTSAIRKWLKLRGTVSIVLTVKSDAVDDILGMLKTVDGIVRVTK